MTFVSSTQPKFYAYAVIDTGEPHARIVAVRLSRREARDFIKELPPDDQATLRVRRARVLLYER